MGCGLIILPWFIVFVLIALVSEIGKQDGKQLAYLLFAVGAFIVAFILAACGVY